MDRLLTIDEIADRLGVSRKTVYKWTHLGKIPVARAGRLLRFVEADVMNWLRRDISTPGPSTPARPGKISHRSREKCEVDRLVEICTSDALK